MESPIKLVTLKEAVQATSIKEFTVRSWVRQGLVAGTIGKPFLVHLPSLFDYIITKKANKPLQELYSTQVVNFGCHSQERSGNGVL